MRRWVPLVAVAGLVLVVGLWALAALLVFGPPESNSGQGGLFSKLVSYESGLLQGVGDSINDVALAADGQTIAVALRETVEVRSFGDGKLLSTLQIRTATDLALSPDGSLLAVRTSDRPTISLWLVSDGSALEHQPRYLGSTAAFSPDGGLLAIGGSDEVWLYRFADGTPVHTLPAAGQSVTFSPDGRLLAAGGDHISIWNVADGSLAHQIQGWNHAAFAPDGQLMAVAESATSGAIVLRRVNTGAVERTLQAPISQVRAIEFSPDGQLIAGVYADSKARIWRVADGTTAHEDQLDLPFGVRGVYFTPQGQSLLLWNSDNIFTLPLNPAGQTTP